MAAEDLIICVPSKGRPNTKIVDVMATAGLKPVIFVEPQDAKAYAGLPIYVMEKNNQGLPYARNAILEYARESGQRYLFMCDDDIQHFCVVRNQRAAKTDASVVTEGYEQMKKGGFTLAGLAFRQYGWADKQPVRVNSKLPVACVYLDLQQTTAIYRQYTLKGDYDFALQVLQGGGRVGLFNRLCFHTPDIGTNPGGLHEVYSQSEAHRSSVRELCAAWPRYTTAIKRKGRYDVKIDVKQLARDTNQHYV